MGGRGGSFAQAPLTSYESFPVSLRIGGSKYATPEEKQKKTATVTRFMNDAQVGNVYSVGAGIGSTGGAQFEIVSFNRSPNKMGLRWIGSNSRAVALSRVNAASFIANGAKMVKRGK